jgi:hypothetical protein
MPVQLDSSHSWHVNVGDQAGGFRQKALRQEIGCRRENVDRIAQRSHEPAHGLTKEPIIFNDRNQYLFHHAPYGHSLDPSCSQLIIQL